MRLLALALGLVILLTGTPGWTQDATAPQTQRVLDRLSERLPAVRGYLDELESTPESSMIWRDRTDAQQDLDFVLDEIIALIVDQDYQQKRESLFRVEDRIEALELAIDELRVARITAPASPEQLGLVDRTLGRAFAPGSREAIDAEIEMKTADITGLVRERNSIIREFQNRLHEYYEVDLNTDQARSVLYQINGSSIVEASVTFAVLQQIESRLAEIRTATSNDEILRRYYGMAALLRLVTARLHERHLAQYEETWLPAINALGDSQDQLIAETETAIAMEDDSRRLAAYENNLSIQINVRGVIDEYRELLLDRQEVVRTRFIEAEQDSLLAINTLKTLENARILFDQFSWSTEEFNALMAIGNSDLIPLDDAEVTENYLDLSRQMLGS